MANPQTENGFTRIANEVLESVYSRKFSANQLTIVLVIWRKTYGYQRKEHEFSLSYFSEVTGIDRKAVKRVVDSLIENKVILVVKEAGFTSARVLEFNKDYEEWTIEHRGGKNDHTTGGKNDHTTGGKNDHTTGGKNDHHKRNNKENIKKEEEEAENPIQLYESNFGIMTTHQIESLWKWVDDFNNKEIINMAIRESAIVNPKTPFKYLDRILVDWHRRKLFTIEAILKEKEKREKEIANKQPYPNKGQAPIQNAASRNGVDDLYKQMQEWERKAAKA